MDERDAKLLIASFLDRLAFDESTGKWRLEGSLSQHEVSALRLIAGVTDRNRPSSEQAGTSAPPAVQARPLNVDSLKLAEPENPEVILCLDFGTAMSKAFATSDSDEDLVELALGKGAGEPKSVFAVTSSLYISKEGRIFFGHEAVAQSTRVVSEERRRFDSLKQEMSQGPIGNLDEDLVGSDINPTAVPLTKADLITIFLAYLTDLAATELSERHGVSRYVRRRFAKPVWKQDRAEWVENELQTMLAKAQILADTFHGEWPRGLPVAEVKAVLAEVHKLPDLPTFLIDQGVLEPVAAGSNRFRREGRGLHRELVLVIDVGAGTSDFAMFAVVENRDREIFKVWVIPNSVEGIRQAGDTVDRLLEHYILAQQGLTAEDGEYKRVRAGLSLSIRAWKEDLFRGGRLEYTLENDASGVVDVEEFVGAEGMQRFSGVLKRKMAELMASIDPSWIAGLGQNGISVLLTGGGANLPVVQALATGSLVVDGRSVQCRPAPRFPEWIEDEYPDLVPEFPQLAVAIGGAARDLPDVAPETAQFLGLSGDPRGWQVEVF